MSEEEKTILRLMRDVREDTGHGHVLVVFKDRQILKVEQTKQVKV